MIRNKSSKLIIATNRLILILETLTNNAGTGMIRGTSANAVIELNGLVLATNTSTGPKVGETIRMNNETLATVMTCRNLLK